jgi:hypothetical protein
MDSRSGTFDTTDDFLKFAPFSLQESKKDRVFLDSMRELTHFHKVNCVEYSRIISHLSESRNWDESELAEIPYIPVRLFKHLELLSIREDQVFKIMHSSGTSGQLPSKIYLDKSNVKMQSVILAKLFREFIPLDRPPILIIDSEETVKNRNTFSARAAGILGFSFLGRDVTFALKSDMSLDIETINHFFEKYEGKSVLIFGFTSIIWEYLLTNSEFQKLGVQLADSYVLHGGGWKKLASLDVDNSSFKEKVQEFLGITSVINYYGLVEQTGSIYFECMNGFFHTSEFSNLIIREEKSFNPENIGSLGIIQLQSVLPRSYPGHSILTEDLGIIFGVDDCLCGRLGQRFKVFGRIPNAEIRGCSDTHGG